MPKRKAETLSQLPAINENKKVKHEETSKSNQINLLDDSDSGSEDESGGGALLEESGFKINEEYAKRFQHNKKREELMRLEEKYEKPAKPNKQYGDKYDEDSESSNDEDEDDEGFLATEALDAEISATLRAIRSKDPRVYDEKVKFYAPIEEGEDIEPGETKQEKPMFLNDYHRENLLKGHTGSEDEMEVDAPRTFAQEQDELKKSIVKEMHAAAEDDSSSDEHEDGGFLVPKAKPQASGNGVHPSRAAKLEVDIAVADRDPEQFLSNFMEARAWVPSDGARFQPLESDDEEEDERAEKFEEAYNLRFEKPGSSNEVLKSYARDVVAAKSVRREEPNSRKKQRDFQREKKDRGKIERDEERAQLRRLKIDEMEEKLQKIKKAAGIRGKTLKDEDWTKFLDEGWDDDKWEAEMSRRFGENYYAEQEGGSDNESDAETGNGKKKKAKKPTWDDDIDIKDLVPDFEDDSNDKVGFTLSDSDEENVDEDGAKQSKSSKDRQQEKAAKKKASRIERKKIEDLVDSRLDLDLPLKSKQAAFRYRETSPISFGLTAKDILMAPDTSLNQFAGLKKMASFRDPEKKRKDKKNLGKKARLRQWRKDTFGNEDGPEITIGASPVDTPEAKTGVDIVEGKKKKKRSRKSKGQVIEL
ncbi:kri1 [Hyphodiscus hymeniophilus]|uniref:Kri1 n=1 Tax=Hyphodiscus hymeniophilus TaxID=353542 RepID=A0A9P6VF44_9HELO|nr:kri1 [Hyphodiscus hymeniophilus]